MMENVKLYNGNCLEQHRNIESGSVDLILTDPPYGTVKNIRSSPASKTTGLQVCEWDDVIVPSELFEIANRILRKNGKMVLFSQEPYTTELITKAIPNLPFGYRMIWKKDHFANSLLSKKAPVILYEDVLVFSKVYDMEGLHPLREYFMEEKQKSGLTSKQITKLLGNQMGSHYFTNGVQFAFPTFENYSKLQSTGYFQKPYDELKKIDKKFNNEFSSTFNLWEGKKYKSNILEYKKDYNGWHPTQKPVLLLEDLIKTFSNEGDLVVDLTMGSGSTGVAAKNTKRRFVGIEMEKQYFDIAEMRINKVLKPYQRQMDENGFFQSSIFDIINQTT